MSEDRRLLDAFMAYQVEGTKVQKAEKLAVAVAMGIDMPEKCSCSPCFWGSKAEAYLMETYGSVAPEEICPEFFVIEAKRKREHNVETQELAGTVGNALNEKLGSLGSMGLDGSPTVGFGASDEAFKNKVNDFMNTLDATPAESDDDEEVN